MAVRPQFDLDLPDPVTIRSVVDWYKAHIPSAPLPSPEYPTGEEVTHMNSRWTALISQLASELQVPVGWLSYSINDLVQWEVRLAETALAEGGAEIFGGVS